jgi:hypothetical protein
MKKKEESSSSVVIPPGLDHPNVELLVTSPVFPATYRMTPSSLGWRSIPCTTAQLYPPASFPTSISSQAPATRAYSVFQTHCKYVIS